MGSPTTEAFVRFFAQGAQYDFSGSFPVQMDGSFGGDLTVPADAPVGTYTVTVWCVAGDQVLPPEFETSYTIIDGPRPTLSASPSSAVAGALISASGTNCEIDGQPLASVVAFLLDRTGASVASTDAAIGGDGSWSATLVVPENALGGDHRLRARCTGDAGRLQPLDATVAVVARSTTTPSTTPTLLNAILPETG